MFTGVAMLHVKVLDNFYGDFRRVIFFVNFVYFSYSVRRFVCCFSMHFIYPAFSIQKQLCRPRFVQSDELHWSRHVWKLWVAVRCQASTTPIGTSRHFSCFADFLFCFERLRPDPQDEIRRIGAYDACGIFNIFENLFVHFRFFYFVSLSCTISNCPVLFITIVEENRQDLIVITGFCLQTFNAPATIAACYLPLLLHATCSDHQNITRPGGTEG